MAGLFRAVVSGVGFDVYNWPATAPAPSGGVYLGLSDANGEGHFARVTANGVPVWSSKFETTYVLGVVSNATHVAFIIDPGTATGAGVMLRDSSNALVWQTQVPAYSDSSKFLCAAISSAGAVALFTPKIGLSETVLTLLNAGTGAITWAVNLCTAGGDAPFAPHSVSFLSGGDLVVSFLRTGGQTVQRISAADGSVVWSRNITGMGAYAVAGVDDSDNVYIVGEGFGSPAKLPLLKLDSSGATLWARQVEQPAGLLSAGLTFSTCGGLTAGATGVYVPVYYGGSPTQYCGCVFVPADGAIATGNASIVTVNRPGAAMFSVPGVAGAVSTSMAMGYMDGDGWTVITGGSTSADDNAWGPYVRTTWAANVAAGTMAASASSYTRESTGSFTASAISPTAVAGTMTFTTYTNHSVALSVPTTTAFGTPELAATVAAVQPWPVSTSFGTPVSKITLLATSLTSSLAFGLGEYEPDRTYALTGIDATTTFGLASSTRGLPPPPRDTQAAAPSTLVGTPSAAASITLAAEGFEGTTLGEPISGRGVTATGFDNATAFGSPVVLSFCIAQGLRSAAAFGLPVAGGFGQATGRAHASLGTPSARSALAGAVTALASTAFGTPLCGGHSRARSAVFRARFGQAQAERTAP